jgi:hypothetical protein
VLLALLLVLAGAFFAVTRGPIARRIVLAQLRPLSDAEVDIRGATIGIDGTVTIEGLSVAAPGLDGPAARILDAHAATISIAGLFSGAPRPRSIHIDNPILRISQDTATGDFNFAAIHPRPSGASKAPLPAVSVTRGVLELGEHTGDAYEALRRLPVVATLEPTPAADTFAFNVVQDSPEAAPFSLSGIIRPDRVEVSIDELDLAAWPNDAIPSRIRALHSQLDIRWRVLPTRMTIYRSGGVELEVALRGVELRLPVEDAPVARGVMTGVDGTLRIDRAGAEADLSGLLDGVPASASFRADRLAADAPFTCDIHVGRVRLAENIERLGYIPEFVREQLEIFSNPTAELALDLTLTRRDGSGEVVPSGLIHLYDGVASYRSFPYEFSGLEGVFELADDALIIRSVSGDAASGAHLEATGRIGPLGPIAEATIDINVTNVPLDNRLRAGLGQKHRDLYDALLSRPAYQRLQELGLVQSPARARERAAELEALRAGGPGGGRDGRSAELASLASVPVFALGGRAAVDVHIHRHLGDENRWERDIEVRIPSAGFLPERFPLPIIAEQVTLHIDDEAATLAENDGVFRGLEGGVANISAVAPMGETPGMPIITIDAADIPVTPLLINAIPGEPGAGAARDLLARLGLEGTLGCSARIGHPGRPLFEIDVRPRGMTARVGDWGPAGGPALPALRLDDIAGRIHATPEALQLDLSASLPPGPAVAPPRATLSARVDYDPASPEGLQIRTLDAEVNRFPLTTPIEQVVALVNEEAAGQLYGLRSRFDPRGVVRVRVEGDTARFDGLAEDAGGWSATVERKSVV